MSQPVQQYIHFKSFSVASPRRPYKGPSFDKVDREENSQAHGGIQTNDLLQPQIWDP